MRFVGGLSRVLLSSARLPYILCGAPTLLSLPSAKSKRAKDDRAVVVGGGGSGCDEVSATSVSSAFHRLSATTTATDGAVPLRSSYGRASSPAHAAVGSLPKARQKELKRRGFHIIINWCRAHQQLATVTMDSDGLSATLDMDAAALDWIQTFTPFFSCGQSLVLIGFLSDTLLRLAELETALGTSRADVAADEKERRRLTSVISDAVCHLGVLVHRVTESDQLERQPLPAIMSAVYGLHRLTEPGSPLPLDDITQSTLLPPNALLFAMLYAVRSTFSSVAASSTPVGEEGMDSRDAAERREDGAKDVMSTQVLLTFLLVMTPSRRQELLSGGDQAMIRIAVQQLVQRVEGQLQSCSFLNKEAKRLADERKATLAGERDTSASDGASNGEAAGGSTTTAALELLEAAGRADEKVYVSLQECLNVMRNIHFTAASSRMVILQFLLCVLHTPCSLVKTDDDLALLAKILSCIHDIPRHQRVTVTDYIIVSVPVPQRVSTVTAFLLHIRRPESYRKRLCWTPEKARALPPEEAAALLAAGLGEEDWPLTQALILTAVSDDDLAEALATCTASTAETLAGETVRVAKQPLTPLMVTILTALLPRGAAPQQPSTGERERWFALLAGVVDWSSGVVTAPVREGTSHHHQTCAEITKEGALEDGRGAMAAPQALPALQAYLHAVSLSAVEKVDDRLLLNHYARYIFRAGNGATTTAATPTIAQTLHVLTQLTDHLTSSSHQRQLLERTIRYNGTASLSALFRFLDVLAPRAAASGIDDQGVLAQLRKQNSLDPGKLVGWRSRHVEEAAPSTSNSASADGEVDLASPKHYFHCLRNGIAYVVAVKASWQAVGGADDMRYVVGRWVGHFFRYAAPARTPSAPGRLAEDGEGSDLRVASTDETEEGEESEEPTAAVTTPCDDGGSAGGDGDGDPDLSEERDTEEKTLATDDDSQDPASSSELHYVLSDAEKEEIIVLAICAGARLPTNVVAEIAQRLREQLVAPPLAPAAAAAESAGTESSEPRRHLYVKLPSTTATDSLWAAPVESLPSPAQFVALVRGHCGFALPLSNEYLRHLLAKSDPRIFLAVVTTFVNSVKSNRDGPNLRDDLEMAVTAMSAFLSGGESGVHEGEARAEADKPHVPPPAATTATLIAPGQGQSETTAALVKFLLSHLLHSRRGAKELAGIIIIGEESATAPTATPPHRGPTGGSVPAASSSPHDAERVAEVRKLQRAAEGLFLRALSSLARAQVKDVGLTQQEGLRDCFPQVHAYLALRLTQQVDDFSSRELLLLATCFPQTMDAVLSCLAKHDISLTVNFGEFHRLARNLPMQVVEAVVFPHLPNLSFTWCTRLLSTLSLRHEEVSFPLLSRVLSRASDQVDEDTSQSDRNLLLMVLQGYLSFNTEACAAAPSSVEEPSTSSSLNPTEDADEEEEEVELVNNASSSKDSGNGVDGAPPTDSIFSPEEAERRRAVILEACDKLLNVDSITDLAALQSFLAAYPESLQSVTDAAVIRRAEKHVLGELLQQDPRPIAEIRLYALTMMQHRLLTATSRQLIVDRLFADEEAWHSMVAGSADGLLRDGDGEVIDRERLLTLTVGLAIVLSLAGQRGSSPLERVSQCFDTLPEQLLILSLLADAVASFRKGQQSFAHRHSGAAHTPTPVEQLHGSVVDSLCRSLLVSANQLSSSELARLTQNISRLRRWDVVKAALQADPEAYASFHHSFTAAFQRADAHSRCVVAKALASDPTMFAQYEELMMGLLKDDVDVLPNEDLELLLVAVLQMSSVELVEQTLDTVGTRLLATIQQSKRSALVRLLQCHAKFRIHDDDLLTKAAAVLEKQCTRGGDSDFKLDIPQVLTVLQAASRLQLSFPERFLELCFMRLERSVEQMKIAQLSQACQLAVELEMGYTTSIHILVSRLLDSREGLRNGEAFRAVVELVCDEYEVEIPQQLRQLRLRGRRKRDRLEDYWYNCAARDADIEEDRADMTTMPL